MGFQKHKMREWKSVIPTEKYPLPNEAVKKADPHGMSTLSTRTMFTPAEDDLLLRGLISTGEDWTKVKKELLPSKEEQLLRFRYRKLTASCAAARENRFREYLRLERDRKFKDSKWTHREDLSLLRGYQVFGEKWPMINIFFLPHRHRKEIKSRWAALVKERLKSFKHCSDVENTKGHDKALAPAMRDFLVWLRGASSNTRFSNPVSSIADDEGKRGSSLAGVDPPSNLSSSCPPTDSYGDIEVDELISSDEDRTLILCR